MNTYTSTNEIYMLLFLIAKTKNPRQVFDFYITLYISLKECNDLLFIKNEVQRRNNCQDNLKVTSNSIY